MCAEKISSHDSSSELLLGLSTTSATTKSYLLKVNFAAPTTTTAFELGLPTPTAGGYSRFVRAIDRSASRGYYLVGQSNVVSFTVIDINTLSLIKGPFTLNSGAK